MFSFLAYLCALKFISVYLKFNQKSLSYQRVIRRTCWKNPRNYFSRKCLLDHLSHHCHVTGVVPDTFFFKVQAIYYIFSIRRSTWRHVCANNPVLDVGSDTTLASRCFLYMLAMWLFRPRSWWRHQMETFSTLLAICAGNSPVPGEFPAQWPVARSFDVFFDLRPNKRLSKQSWGWWFETLSSPLWRHCNVLWRGTSQLMCQFSLQAEPMRCWWPGVPASGPYY